MITYVDIWGMGAPVFEYIEESYRHLSPLLPCFFSISSWREEACPPGLLLHSDKADSSDVSYLLISCGMDGLLFVLCFLLVFFLLAFSSFFPSATLCSLSPVLCAATFRTNPVCVSCFFKAPPSPSHTVRYRNATQRAPCFSRAVFIHLLTTATVCARSSIHP